MSTTPAIPVPQSAAPIDPATLAQWATSLLRSLPGDVPAAPVPGAQPPANWAPGGSPLAAPSGFSPLKLRSWFLTLPGVTSRKHQDGDPANNHNVLLRQKNGVVAGYGTDGQLHAIR